MLNLFCDRNVILCFQMLRSINLNRLLSVSYYQTQNATARPIKLHEPTPRSRSWISLSTQLLLLEKSIRETKSRADGRKLAESYRGAELRHVLHDADDDVCKAQISHSLPRRAMTWFITVSDKITSWMIHRASDLDHRQLSFNGSALTVTYIISQNLPAGSDKYENLQSETSASAKPPGWKENVNSTNLTKSFIEVWVGPFTNLLFFGFHPPWIYKYRPTITVYIRLKPVTHCPIWIGWTNNMF